MADVSTPIIVALDYPNIGEALSMAEKLDPSVCRLKVGKELFTRSGPAGVEALQKRNGLRPTDLSVNAARVRFDSIQTGVIPFHRYGSAELSAGQLAAGDQSAIA